MIKRIGKDSTIRAHIGGKCGGCLFVSMNCDGVTISKEYTNGEMVILECTGYQQEVLSMQDIKNWQKKYGIDAPLPVTQKQLRAGNLKVF